MLKKTIKYTDFNDEEREDVFYFNLTEPEMLELETENGMGLGNLIQHIIETNDTGEIIKMFKAIILSAYGEKDADGVHFVKSEEITKRFTQHAAYPVLYLEIGTNADAAAEFLKGVMPSKYTAGIDGELKKLTSPKTHADGRTDGDSPVGPPPPRS